MIRNFKICMLFFSMLTLHSITGFAQKKISYGVGIDVFQTQLNNIDRENFSGYGHSVPGFVQNDRMGFGINAIARMPIYKGLGLETGLGIARYQSQFHFEYRHVFSQLWMDKTFNIGLNYLRVPLNLYYDFKISPKSSILISGGVNFKLLLWADDNFEKIMFEEIFLVKPYRRYNSTIFNFLGGISYKHVLSKGAKIEIGLIVGQDISCMTKRNPITQASFGFYSNLRNSYYSQYGLSLKYFFTK